VLQWAQRYSYADDDDEVRQIGERSRRAGFYTREDFLSRMVKKLIFASEQGKFTRPKAHAASRS
jgi:hypothetical protein